MVAYPAGCQQMSSFNLSCNPAEQTSVFEALTKRALTGYDRHTWWALYKRHTLCEGLVQSLCLTGIDLGPQCCQFLQTRGYTEGVFTITVLYGSLETEVSNECLGIH